jgi:aminodeoxyfutalosine deaminase
MADAITYSARWIFPVSTPPFERGTLTVEGTTIAAVEAKGVRTPDVDLGNVAIIPGLVNCHTHLDLSGARGTIPPTDPEHFTDWLKGVIAYRRNRTPEQVQADIRTGLAECMRHGTTLVGDIAAGGASWDAIADEKTRAIVFYEEIGLSEERGKQTMLDSFKWWARRAIPLCRAGHSPHSPYSACSSLIGLAGALRTAAIHFAESPDEMELITYRIGSFVPFLRILGVWEGASFIRSIQSALTSSAMTAHHPILLIHANYLPQEVELSNLQSIIYCPRTHAAFGHPRHPFREFQARGVRVALGTDSLASNPDLDLLAEARFIHSIRPEVPCDELLRMATLTGAEALGWADQTGSLEAGKSADFVALPLANRDAVDPHELIFGEDFPNAARRTLFRGEWRD